mmetsp:Transcript_10099/g.23606  ORF Transcript_10099/g.23606 Transcript_10099/m.23606 type:complete len:291 (-) Transcript_10099:1277-2149(-)
MLTFPCTSDGRPSWRYDRPRAMSQIHEPVVAMRGLQTLLRKPSLPPLRCSCFDRRSFSSDSAISSEKTKSIDPSGEKLPPTKWHRLGCVILCCRCRHRIISLISSLLALFSVKILMTASWLFTCALYTTLHSPAPRLLPGEFRSTLTLPLVYHVAFVALAIPSHTPSSITTGVTGSCSSSSSSSDSSAFFFFFFLEPVSSAPAAYPLAPFSVPLFAPAPSYFLGVLPPFAVPLSATAVPPSSCLSRFSTARRCSMPTSGTSPCVSASTLIERAHLAARTREILPLCLGAA